MVAFHRAWVTVVIIAALVSGVGYGTANATVPGVSPKEAATGGLRMTKRTADEARGAFGYAGSLVSFETRQRGSRTFMRVEVNGVNVDFDLDHATRKVIYDGHNRAFGAGEKAALQALAQELARSLRPDIRKLSPHEHVLIAIAVHFSEVPVGYTLAHRQVGGNESARDSHPNLIPVGSCRDASLAQRTGRVATTAAPCQQVNGNGITSIGCTAGNKWHGHDLGGAAPAENHCFINSWVWAGPGSRNCKGKCGPKCLSVPGVAGGWYRDCLDHDECTERHSTVPSDSAAGGCGDEWNEASDDTLYGEKNCSS